MTTLHPKGVNHLAIATRDMKGQLEFWCDVLGCPLKALFWMHGVEGAYHGFVELSKDSYISFVQAPDIPDNFELGLTHSSLAMPVAAGLMQHVALHVDDLDELVAMRDRIRSRGIQVMGPIDHGFVQSIYFAGPEGLNLEVACGSEIPAEQWIDPEVQGLCGISAEEVAAMKNPAGFAPSAEPVPQPDFNPDVPHWGYPEKVLHKLMGRSDKEVWEELSETTPPVPAAEATKV